MSQIKPGDRVRVVSSQPDGIVREGVAVYVGPERWFDGLKDITRGIPLTEVDQDFVARVKAGEQFQMNGAYLGARGIIVEVPRTGKRGQKLKSLLIGPWPRWVQKIGERQELLTDA